LRAFFTFAIVVTMVAVDLEGAFGITSRRCRRNLSNRRIPQSLHFAVALLGRVSRPGFSMLTWSTSNLWMDPSGLGTSLPGLFARAILPHGVINARSWPMNPPPPRLDTKRWTNATRDEAKAVLDSMIGQAWPKLW